jgi:hypothetical protein
MMFYRLSADKAGDKRFIRAKLPSADGLLWVNRVTLIARHSLPVFPD